MAITKEDLYRFADQKHHHPQVNKPWSEGDYSYATDSIVIVRTPRMNSIEEMILPLLYPRIKLNQIPWDWRPDKYLPVPFVPAPIKEPCDECIKHPGICALCNGTGDFGKYDCPDCTGTGECDYCDGTGMVEPFHKTKLNSWLGDQEFQTKYISMLYTLPKCEIATNIGRFPARFKFDGGDGFLMPCWLNEEKEGG